MLFFVKTEWAKDLTSSDVIPECVLAKSGEPSPERKARVWASSRARVAGFDEAAALSSATTGKTYSANSCRVNWVDVIMDVKTST
jgi:hypothetical protein